VRVAVGDALRWEIDPVAAQYQRAIGQADDLAEGRACWGGGLRQQLKLPDQCGTIDCGGTVTSSAAAQVIDDAIAGGGGDAVWVLEEREPELLLLLRFHFQLSTC